MKKIISILLSLAMLATMCAGLNLTAYAKELNAVSFNIQSNSPQVPDDTVVLYEDWHGYTETDSQGQDYFVYELNGHDLVSEGSQIELQYDDSSPDVYECVREYHNENDYDLVYKCGNDVLELRDIEIRTTQNENNKWTAGHTYEASVYYQNVLSANTLNVQIDENPVESVTVNYDRPITLVENSEGRWINDDGNEPWFMYYSNNHYLNEAGVTLDVDFTDGTSKTYEFFGNDWLPCDEDGEPIDERFFEFGFNQLENHLYPGVTGRTARIEFLGKGGDVPVQVLDEDDIYNSGSISVGDHRKALFVGDEWHTITFTPEDTSVYIFEESLADKIIWEGNRFDGMLLDSNGDEVESLSNEWMAYVLEGGETYTLKARKIEESGPMFEFLSVKDAIVAPVSVNFTPNWEYYTFYNGNLATDDAFYEMGNELEVTFGDGDTKTFICNNVRDYRYYGDGEYGEEGINLRDYANEKGCDFNCEPRCNIDAYRWDRNGDDNYLEIYVGTAYQKVDVTDEIEDSPYKSIKFYGEPLKAYDGTSRTERGINSEGEWVDYQRYDINRWDLEKEGNRVVVTYTDDTTETFTCVRDEEYGYLQFRSNESDEPLQTEEFGIDDKQGPDNEWELNGTYSVDVYLKGKKCAFNAQVVDSPVDHIDVSLDGDIEVFENRNGHREYDNETDEDYFRYDDGYDYLRARNAVITVYYTNENQETYDFHTKDWIPCDSEGNRIDERFFEFRFDQDENHFAPDADNKAYVEFYGKREYMDVAVVETHDVNEGTISTGDIKPVLFLDGEEHTFTFTPENDGAYQFEDSLVNCWFNDSDFSLTVKDSSGEEVSPMQANDEDLMFYLYGDETYTITSSLDRGGMTLEYLSIRERVSITGIDYTHAGGTITVSNGDFGDGREIFDEGSTLTVYYSNGEVETFTANDNGEFRNSEGRDVRDMGYEYDVYRECELYITPNVEMWELGKTARYVLTLCNARKVVNLNVEESDVSSITYHSKKSPELVKDVDFYNNSDENRCDIYNPPFFEGDYVEVTYNDERGTITYYYDWGDSFYRDTNNGWERIHLAYRYDNSQNYDIGDDIAFQISYLGAKANITAEVVENDVDHITFTPGTPYRVLKEERGEWDSDDYWDEEREENVHVDYFHYETPSIDKFGNKLTVYYTDGTSSEFIYNGRRYMNEEGEVLDQRYLYSHDTQYRPNAQWTVGDNNYYFIGYKNAEAPINVEVVDLGEWSARAWACDNKGNIYEDGDTLRIEKGETVWLYFETDPRNREHGITDFAGWSDCYDRGTLTQAGFRVEQFDDNSFSNYYDNVKGLRISTNNLRVGKTGVLNYFLYEHEYEEDEWYIDNFDYINTPHAADFTLNVEVVDHTFTESAVVPATCTEKGYTEYTCETCGMTFRGNYTDYAPHSYTQTVTPATPNAKGYTTYSCDNCDFEYVGDFTAYASDDSVLVASVGKMSSLVAADYSPETFAALEDAIDASEGIEAGTNPQIEIDNAVSQILSSITDLKAYLNLTVSGENGTVTQSEQSPLLQGTSVTLTATPDSGYTFEGWFEKNTKRIFSRDAEYTFVITSNTDFEALFVPQGAASLIFTNKTGQHVQTISKAPAEWAQEASIEALAPAVPYSYGCTNGEWVIPADALTKLSQGETVVIVPQYDETGAFEPTATATDGTPALNLYYTYDTSNNVGSFVMAVDIPDGCTVESVGTAFYYKKAASFNPNDFILTINNKTTTSKFDDLTSGVHVTNITRMSSYYNWAARGYVSYYDGSGNLKTAYSNQINVVNRQQI